MSRELTVAYRRIRTQWPELAVRMHVPRNKGWPDFIFIQRNRTTFVEVKWFIDHDQVPYVEPKQWDWLNKIAQHGGTALLLCGYDNYGSTFGLPRAGWVAWRAPLLREFTMRRASRLSIPKPWWVGAHLADLNEQLRVD